MGAVKRVMAESNREHCLSGARLLLAGFGYQADPARVERVDGRIRFYHYTHAEYLDAILSSGGGLRPRRTAPCVPGSTPLFVLEGLLNPWPAWMSSNPYFGDLGAEMFAQYVGEIPLAVTIPESFPNIWVADGAHLFECKHATRRGSAPLGLGYDCSNGQDAVKAFGLSQIPIAEYVGGHIAPVVQVYSPASDIAIPAEWIRSIQ